MPIKITCKELLEVAGSGALARFFAIPKATAAGYRNRRMPAAVEEELRHINDARLKLVEKFGGIIPAPGALSYAFPEGRQKEFEDEFAILQAESIELPGEPMLLSDLRGDGLTEADFDRLAEFIKSTP